MLRGPCSSSCFVLALPPMAYSGPKQKLLNELNKNPFVLAPMAAITDLPYRSFIKEMGAGIVVSELISATGLKYSSSKTKELMRFHDDQHPVGIQIFGENAEHMREAALYIEQTGADFVDINFGCPVPKVVKRGAGSAMLKDLPAMTHLLRELVKSVSIPVTIKIRTGWDLESKNADLVSQIAYDEGICWVAIHGRTRSQGYEGAADWDYIAEIKSKAKLPIIGNGDIQTAQAAVQTLDRSKCDGVMIGRGALKNPLIFFQAQKLRSFLRFGQEILKPEDSISHEQIIQSLLSHLERDYDARLVELQFKKLVTWFATGYPHATQFRKQIYQAQGIEPVKHLASEFFRGLDQSLREINNNFLMGGHG